MVDNLMVKQEFLHTGASVSASLAAHIAQRIDTAGGWLPFDEFMQAALYTPGLGYYANSSAKFGHMPPTAHQEGSDFVTAPELSPLFGACLGEQVVQALQASNTRHVIEFGAGSGALALQICELLAHSGYTLDQYFIVELSANLRARQQEKLAAWAGKITWLDALPPAIEGVVIGNEVLDAMPVKLLARKAGVWHERGVTFERSLGTDSGAGAERSAESMSEQLNNGQFINGKFIWQDRASSLRPPIDIAGSHDYLTEIHPQAEAFMHTLAQHLERGAAFFIDYGFPDSEYYHPQRHMGTLMCHFQHRADPDPLAMVGLKDITAHVNFSAIALAGQDAGLDVLGYSTQARFLMDCGLLQKMEDVTLMQRAMAAKLATEHEMGELFKVVGFAKGFDLAQFEPLGFANGDRSQTL